MIFFIPECETPPSGLPVIGPPSALTQVTPAPSPTLARQYGDWADRSRLMSLNQWLAYYGKTGTILTDYSIYPMPVLGDPSVRAAVVIRNDYGMAVDTQPIDEVVYSAGPDTPVELEGQFYLLGKKQLIMNAAQFIRELTAAKANGTTQVFLMQQFG